MSTVNVGFRFQLNFAVIFGQLQDINPKPVNERGHMATCFILLYLCWHRVAARPWNILTKRFEIF